MTFDGREVRQTAVAVTNAGDGLSKALAVDPRELHLGEEIFVVLRCEVAKVRFDPISNDGDDLVRVHVLRASDGTLADGKDVKRLVEDQKQRIIAHDEELKGIQQLPDELHAEHLLGAHTEVPEPGCPDCPPVKAKRAAKKAAKKTPGAKKRGSRAKKGTDNVAELRP